MSPQDLNSWRGRTDERLHTLVTAVTGGDGRDGLVKEVSDIRIRLAGYQGMMIAYASIGTFCGTVIGSIVVAVFVKYILKQS